MSDSSWRPRPELVRAFLEHAAKPVYANLNATFALPPSEGVAAWPELLDINPDLRRIIKRESADYVPYDGMTVSQSAAYPGQFVVESIAARTDLSALSRDLILLSAGPQPVRYASGYWKQMPANSIWIHIRNAGQIFGPVGEYGFELHGTKWDAPWHVTSAPSSSAFLVDTWDDVDEWWKQLKAKQDKRREPPT